MKLTEGQLKDIYRRGTSRPPQSRECLTEAQMAQIVSEEAGQQERLSAARHMMRCSDCAEEFRIARSTHSWALTLDGDPERTRSAASPSLWHRLTASLSTPRLAYALAALLLAVTASLIIWAVTLTRETARLEAKVSQQSAELERAEELSQSLDRAREEMEASARRSDQYQSQIDGLKKQNEQLSRSVEELSRPQINAYITDITPDDSIRGGGQAARTIVVPSYAGAITVNLNLAEQPPYSTCSMEIFNQSGQLVLQLRGLRISPDNTITLSIPSRLMTSGLYRIKLYGSDNGRKNLVEDYRVRIRRS